MTISWLSNHIKYPLIRLNKYCGFIDIKGIPCYAMFTDDGLWLYPHPISEGRIVVEELIS